MKKVIVTSINWKELIEVDETIFDDYKLEACTQAIEKALIGGMTTVSALLQCWDEHQNYKLSKNISVYNTYKILINAGYHSKAEILRSVFLSKTSVDLAEEPIKG
jgi:hypothetical protein